MLIIKNGKTIGALQLFRVRKIGIVARQNAKDVVVFHGEEEQDRKVMKKILWMLRALHAGEIEKNNIIRYNGTIDMDVIVKETIKEW